MFHYSHDKTSKALEQLFQICSSDNIFSCINTNPINFTDFYMNVSICPAGLGQSKFNRSHPWKKVLQWINCKKKVCNFTEKTWVKLL